MPSSRWLFIPGLFLTMAGCAEEPTEVPPPVAADAVSTEARPIPGKLPDLSAPEPGRFQVAPYSETSKGKADPESAKTKDSAKPADTKPDAEKKPADSKADAEKKPADPKGDAEKKPADSKSGDDKKSADAKEEATSKTPRELVAKAQVALSKDDVDGAVALFEKVVEIDPKHHEALWALAAINQREATQLKRPKSSPYFLKSAAWMRKLRDAVPRLTEVEQHALRMFLYNEACTYAVQGEKEKAFKSLEESMGSGDVSVEQVKADIDQYKSDEELDSLRKVPEFAALLKKLEGQVAELAKKETEAARERAKAALAQNKPFKFAFSLPNLDGKKVSLADFKGKVVIVDVWGTWCPPCRQEIPHFVDLYKKFHEKGLEIVGINYENMPDDEAKKTIKAFVEKNKMPYTCVLGDEETQQQIPNFEGYPTTLFIDRAGKVRAKTVGFEEAMAVELETIVGLLLDEEAPKGP